MQFDASTIFVLLLVVGIVGVLAWAELNSRRHGKPESADAAGTMAAPLPPVAGRTPRTKG